VAASPGGDRQPGGDLGVDADLDEQWGVVTEVGAPVDDGEPGAVGVTPLGALPGDGLVPRLGDDKGGRASGGWCVLGLGRRPALVLVEPRL